MMVLTLASSIETMDLVFVTGVSSLVLCPDDVLSVVSGLEEAKLDDVVDESGFCFTFESFVAALLIRGLIGTSPTKYG